MKVLSTLERDPRWGTRAQLITVQLLIDRGDLGTADGCCAQSSRNGQRNEASVGALFGRLSLSQGDPERAIDTLTFSLGARKVFPIPCWWRRSLRWPTRTRRNHTPESGDDPLEEFIDHHLTTQRCRKSLRAWMSFTGWNANPRRMSCSAGCETRRSPGQALAQWYFARSELRSGKQEEAIALLNRLRDLELHAPVVGRSDRAAGRTATREARLAGSDCGGGSSPET